ncbi:MULTISPECIES: cbb3-type cytochrome c oxidase subunit I [Amniculibacterium]|uniref:cbb3-type cytochrome c oxidase subunit I n=1 Tax=Amniculibacterium TaxID=2715289 RepID=UPI0013DDA875|nr:MULTISPECIES: cbb3-type cytochrome c oxidase subunit I [Amniculibacterium]
MKNNVVGSAYVIIAIMSLFLGLTFGILGGLQYAFPDFLKLDFSFQKIRPLHTYLSVNWIFCAATGIIYYYLPEVSRRKIFSTVLGKIQAGLQVLILVVVCVFFILGKFSGREYLEFPPYMVAIIVLAWVMFMLNVFITLKPNYKTAPVYIYSWTTGLVFFLLTILEAQLWQLPFFNNNIIRDVTVQWKAMGAFVGSWNALVYGTAMYAMERISGDKSINRSKKAFFFYFLGLTNLMFNWGHHTYIVPASPWIKTISYVISMTELLILANIIWGFRQSYIKANYQNNKLSFKFLTYAEMWILLNLILSISISVPYINQFTHGTHITVAHAMGSTIGINTLLILASLTLIMDEINPKCLSLKTYSRWVLTFNTALFFFWFSLIGMGLNKIAGTLENKGFQQIMDELMPYFKVFAASGGVLLVALVAMLLPILKFAVQSLSEEVVEDNFDGVKVQTDYK